MDEQCSLYGSYSQSTVKVCQQGADRSTTARGSLEAEDQLILQPPLRPPKRKIEKEQSCFCLSERGGISRKVKSGHSSTVTVKVQWLRLDTLLQILFYFGNI